MNELKIFAYSGEELRTIQREDGLWWVLRDVCRVLGITNHKMVAQRLDEDEVSLADLIDALGRTQKTTIINEPGLYAVILRSDKPEAKAFKGWVTHDVLPVSYTHLDVYKRQGFIHTHNSYKLAQNFQSTSNPSSVITILFTRASSRRRWAATSSVSKHHFNSWMYVRAS